jgi:phage-related baseplate assembly protein
MTLETIDLSRLPAPEAIEALDFETLLDAFKARFSTSWNAARAKDDSLRVYDTIDLETDSANIAGQAWSWLRLLDRQRVNDGLKALLAVLASKGNLDTVVAGKNVQRQVIIPATGDAAAVMEGDVALLRRYLLAFDLPSSASAGRYLYDAWTAWPQSADKTLGLWDARVNGRAVHGRRGDTDVVLIGPGGRLLTSDELATIRSAVAHPDRTPEAVGLSVMSASRQEYQVALTVEVASSGPSPALLKAEAEKRVIAAATDRIAINGEIPAALLSGAAYGSGIVKVIDRAPVIISADPYAVPVMTSLDIVVEVRS